MRRDLRRGRRRVRDARDHEAGDPCEFRALARGADRRAGREGERDADVVGPAGARDGHLEDELAVGTAELEHLEVRVACNRMFRR